MNETSFIDGLERELRAASRRRVRLALARAPRVRTDAAAVMFAVVVCAAVAVPLLLTGARSARRVVGHGAGPSGPSVVVDCGRTISGQLPSGWRRRSAGAVVAGPIAWYAVRQNANHVAISRSHFVEAIAVVDPQRSVTVSIPPAEQGRLSLDYTSVSPRRRFHLSQGAGSVTFKPCSGPVGQTQFDGGFIVAGPQCAEVEIRPAGEAPLLARFSLGRSCAPGRVENVLYGDGIRTVRFGEAKKTVVRQLDALLGQRGRTTKHQPSLCGIDSEVEWPSLWISLHGGRFVGYQYNGPPAGAGSSPILAAARGLLIGDTLELGKRLYGTAWRVSFEQGGAWFARTSRGQIEGYATAEVSSPRAKVSTIDAGDVGCPAMTP